MLLLVPLCMFASSIPFFFQSFLLTSITMAFVGSSSALRVRSRGSSMAKTSICSQSPFVGRRQSVVSSTTITMRAAPTADLAWVQIVPLSEVEPNKSIARVVAGLDLLVACMEDGQVYCTGNKGTPTGVPLAGGKLIYLNVRINNRRKNCAFCHSTFNDFVM